MHNHTRWSITSPAYLYDIHAILSSSSSLPLDLTSCTYRDHARVCEAIMSSAELEQPREDVVVGEETGGASTSPPRHPSAVSPKAGAKARSRPQRPRIDLDEQIAHANKLAEVSKKMLLAAKSAQKTQKKQKQRLIRKAGKLSAEDLERIAVLKRCGLYADECNLCWRLYTPLGALRRIRLGRHPSKMWSCGATPREPVRSGM